MCASVFRYFKRDPPALFADLEPFGRLKINRATTAKKELRYGF